MTDIESQALDAASRIALGQVALTFDDVLLKPAHSTVMPGEVREYSRTCRARRNRV